MPIATGLPFIVIQAASASATFVRAYTIIPISVTRRAFAYLRGRLLEKKPPKQHLYELQDHECHDGTEVDGHAVAADRWDELAE